MPVIKRIEEVAARDISDGTEAVGVTKRLLLGPQDGAPTFAVRLFSLAPGGHTPAHAHPHEHGVLVLRGQGEVLAEGQAFPIHAGTVVFVRPQEFHGFRNTGPEDLEFLCIVPVHVER